MIYANLYAYALLVILAAFVLAPTSWMREPVQLNHLLILIVGSAICFCIGELTGSLRGNPK